MKHPHALATLLASLALGGSAHAQTHAPATHPTAPATHPTATHATATHATVDPAAPIPAAHAGTTQLVWYGHAAFRITTPAGHVILIDPWITNPSNPSGASDLTALAHVDLILVSHGHFDHVGNSADLARRTGARLVATGDLGESMARYAGYPRSQATAETLGNAGGTISVFDGEATITFVPAVHSSAISPTDPRGAPVQDLRDAGNPGGFLIRVRNGPSIYHTGDTDVFGDMALVHRDGPVTVMLACIGDHYTMGPSRAAEAARLVAPRTLVPMHYGTFPLLTGTPDALRTELAHRNVHTTLRVMHPREAMDL